MEIERKFLVRTVPADVGECARHEITQGYLQVGEHEIRVRQKDNRFFRIEKKGIGVAREETEHPISEAEFVAAMSNILGMVRKTRYEVPCGDHVAELDIYHGELDGLRVVEVEFESVEQSQRFVAPDWFGEEVTDDKRYKNQSLAIRGL